MTDDLSISFGSLKMISKKHVGYLEKGQPWNQLCFCKKRSLTVVLLHRKKPAAFDGGNRIEVLFIWCFSSTGVCGNTVQRLKLAMLGKLSWSTVKGGQRVTPNRPHWWPSYHWDGMYQFPQRNIWNSLFWPTVDGRTLARIDMVNILLFTGVFWTSQVVIAGFLPSTVSTGVTFAWSSIAILQAVFLRLPLALPMSLAIKVLPRQLSFFATLVLSHDIGGAN